MTPKMMSMNDTETITAALVMANQLLYSENPAIKTTDERLDKKRIDRVLDSLIISDDRSR